tara:strand:- start:241 stop:417 length:177 start_codon:yes stop_codon:yes gene_type:complete
MKIGLLKYNVSPPKSVIMTPPTSGTNGTFFSKRYIIATAKSVAIIKGGIATVRLLPLL